MKKILVFVLLSVLCAAVFTGCTRSDSDTVKVDVFWFTYSDTYLTAVRNAMLEQAKEMPHLRVVMHDCESNQTVQTQKIQTAITQGTNLLVVNIVTTGSEDASMTIVNLARAADLPIVFFNREVSNNVIDSYEKACFVGTDADEAGIMLGEAIAQFLLAPENWADGKSIYDLNGDNQINYVMFRGEHGNAEAFGRTKYSIETANAELADSGLRLAPSPANQTSTQYENDGISNFFLYGNWRSDEATNLMGTALSAHSLTNGAIEMIIANNDDMALGAIEAIRARGFNTGREDAGYIPVFGVDATTVAVEAIRAGRMTSTVLQDAEGMAATILFLANNIAEGEELFSNTEGFNIDEGTRKIRVPYDIVN